MSLLYNASLSYNAPSITFNGNIGVSPSSIINLIEIGTPTIGFTTVSDNSNSTTIGVISLDFAPTGQISLEVLGTSRTATVSLQQEVLGTSRIATVSLQQV
jgi:hypothetical protein